MSGALSAAELIGINPAEHQGRLAIHLYLRPRTGGVDQVLPIVIPTAQDLARGEIDRGWSSFATLGWGERAGEFTRWAAQSLANHAEQRAEQQTHAQAGAQVRRLRVVGASSSDHAHSTSDETTANQPTNTFAPPQDTFLPDVPSDILAAALDIVARRRGQWLTVGVTARGTANVALLPSPRLAPITQLRDSPESAPPTIIRGPDVAITFQLGTKTQPHKIVLHPRRPLALTPVPASASTLTPVLAPTSSAASAPVSISSDDEHDPWLDEDDHFSASASPAATVANSADTSADVFASPAANSCTAFQPTLIAIPHETSGVDPESWWPFELVFRERADVVAHSWGNVGANTPPAASGSTAPRSSERLPDGLRKLFLPAESAAIPSQTTSALNEGGSATWLASSAFGLLTLDDQSQLIGQPGSQLRAVIDAGQFGLNADGTLNLEDWALEIVRRRYATTGEVPAVLGATTRLRPLLAKRTRKLLTAIHYNRVFRTSLQSGASGVLAIIKTLDGRDVIQEYSTPEKMAALLHNSLAFPGKGAAFVEPPYSLARALALDVDPALPPLRGIVRMPIIQQDGSIITRSGYDPVTKFWLDSSVKLNVPERPTHDDVQRARAEFFVLLQDFPMSHTAGALAGTLACFFDQLIRPLVAARGGPHPLFAFEAPAGGQGTGKTLLSRTLSTIVTGQLQETTPWPGPEEMPKVVLSALLAGKPCVIFDNIKTVLRSETLECLITTTEYQGRVLGTNQMPSVPNNTTWILTLNNALFGKDLARRCILVRLDAGTHQAFARTGYAIDDLPFYALTHRGALLSAAFTILRAWIQSGMPDGPRVLLGSFESWAKIMSGVLSYIDVPGLEACARQALSRDVDSGEDQEFLERWWELQSASGGRPIPCKELARLAYEEWGFYQKRLDKRVESQRSRALASHLRDLAGAPVGPFEILGPEQGIPKPGNATHFLLRKRA